MKRLQLIEIEDQDWCPRVIRNAVSHPNAVRPCADAALERLEPCEAEVSRTVLRWYGWVIRAGVLTNGPPGKRPLEIGQQDWPLAFRTQIARADVSEIFVAALKDDRTRKATLEVVWGTGSHNPIWRASFARLRSDEKTA